MNNKMIFIYLFSIKILIATPFSPFNRYELSYQTIDSIRSAIRTGNQNTWFSKYEPEERTEYLSLKKSITDQTIGADFSMFGGFEYAKRSSRFGVIRGSVLYTSKHVRASVTGDVYSTERRASSAIGDCEFERFIKQGAHEPITGMFDFRGNIQEGYIEANYKSFTLTTGKKKHRWGPGYKGTLGLSGTSYTPFYFYHLDFVFSTLLHAQVFLCGYEDESLYQKELTSSEKIVINSSGRTLKMFFPRYGAGQRIDFRIGKYVQIGMYELVDFFGTNELNRFANPLQMYYLGNEASGTNNANLFGGIDLNLVINPLRFYGEFVNDDITMLEKTGNPNKYAFQLGAAYYGNNPLITTGFEYTHLTKYIYGHSRVLTRHAHWGESMGWPWGNYQDVFTAYAIFSFPKNISGKIEANYWIKGDGDLKDDWYADGKPDLDYAPYWPENATHIFSTIFSAQYSPFPWLTYSFYWEPIIEEKSFSNGFFTYLRVGMPGKKGVKAD